MAKWRLRRDYQVKDHKAADAMTGVSYLCAPMFGMVTGSSRPQDAMTFDTKAQAQRHQRDYAKGRGYKPERI